jgi:4-carboxymuconolactone decarboxylase
VTEGGGDGRVSTSGLRAVRRRLPRGDGGVRGLAERLHEAGPLSARERRLAKLGIAIGRESEGAVRSHARKAFAEGIEREAIRQVALLAISTGGYPAAMAAYGWINEVLDREG